jgi:protein-S-isoprenylcysteine O-methyltransferase Ste14
LDTKHWILIFLWIAYCFVHSLLADAKIKLFFERIFGKFYRYYRPVYSIIATITLVLILYFQYSFRSPVLINSILIKYTALIIFVIPGFIIMLISIFKYFKSVSGIRSFYDTKPSTELELKGIHRYVRHPLYSGTLLFIWGLFFIFPLVNNLIAVTIITVYVLIGVRFEEKKLIAEFGELYKAYKIKVPMLIPHLKI